jgi:glycosyltransferase involved in cell wall biosynthesis
VPQELKTKMELGLPENKTIIILQGAGINVHRGAEEAVDAMKKVEHAVLIIVGDGDVVPTLKETVIKENLQDKVLFFGKRPYQEMMQFTYHSDIGLTLDKANNINYQFSLPNKVFDYIHAATPIICTNLIEVSNIVQKHDVGEVIEEFTASNLAQKINALVNNTGRLNQLKLNCKKAALVENWEKECEILEEIYPKVDQ